MVVYSSKYLGIQKFETLYTTNDKVISFRMNINLYVSGDEEDDIIESCSEEEIVNMATPIDSEASSLYVFPRYS